MGDVVTVEQREYERLARVEEQVSQLVKGIGQLSKDLHSWQSHYVPRQEIDERFKNVQTDIQELRDGLKDAATSKDITDIKQTLMEMRNDKRSNKAVWAAWTGVVVSALAVTVAVVAIIVE